MAGDEELKELLLKGVTTYDSYELGCGGYGRVYAVDYCGTTCAAKEIHSVLVEDMGDDEMRGAMESCIKECGQWSTLRHPNVVQFLGVYYPDGGGATTSLRLPILVMEMMPENLPSFLNKHQTIPAYIKHSITYDISLGLCYLHNHNPPIAHRHLSSNNILLTVHHVAKISGLGVDKVIKADRKNTMTKSPGTADFMSPESFTKSPWPWLSQTFGKGLRPMWPMSTAGVGFSRLVKAHGQYGLPMDVFSVAGIVLHIFTQQWPTPTKLKEHDHKTEVERRRKYLDKMKGEAKDLKPLLEECLDNDPATRPTIAVVCEKIQSIKDANTNESPPPNITLYLQSMELKSENELLKQQMVQLTTKEKRQESVDVEELIKEKEVLQTELKAIQLKIDTLELKKNIAESKLVHMEKEKMMVDLEMKEIISRHKTEVTEKTARLSQAEERLVITKTKFDQKKQENEDLRVNLQTALNHTEALQKDSQDLHAQVLELQQNFEHEKQLKTEAINKLVKVSFNKPKEQRPVVSSADILKKDREIHKLRGELQKESDKFKKMAEKYKDEIAGIQSRVTEEQQQRQDLEVKYVLCEQENTQLRKELMTTPYVTNGPQIDLDQIPEEPETVDTPDISTNSEADNRDTGWVSIPAGTNTREHGWRDVFVVLHYVQKTLSFFKQEDDSSDSAKALYSFDFSQVRHVKDFDGGEHTQVYVEKKDIKHLIRFSYTAAIKDDEIELFRQETTINASGHTFVDVTVRSLNNCAMCALPLNWNIGQPGRQASHPIMCKRCQLHCHDYHVLLSGDSLSPCPGPTSPLSNASFLLGDRDSKTFYILTKSEEDKDHWYGQLFRLTQTRKQNRRFSHNFLSKQTTL